MEYENAHLKKITDAAGEVSLSHTEQVAMRFSVRAYMLEHPRPRGFIARVRALAVREVFALRLHPVALGLILALSLGAGSSYAAESALPGDPLYVVKTQINERVESALAVSPAAKAKVALAHTENRLMEAEQLASEGRLSVASGAQVQASISEHVQEFENNVAKMASGDSAGTASAQSDLEATLDAHGEVLARIATEMPANQTEIAPILAVVERHSGDARNKRAESEEVVAQAGTRVVASVRSRKAHVEEAVAQTQAAITAASTSVASGVAVGAQADSEQAATTLAAGDAELDHGDVGAAFSTFQKAGRLAERARVHVEAGKRLRSYGRGDVAQGVVPTATLMMATPVATSSATTTSTESEQATTTEDVFNSHEDD